MTEQDSEEDWGTRLVALLGARLKEIRLKAGAVLFEQGDHDDRLFILDEGTLEIGVLTAAGRKLSLSRLDAGAVFGEIAIFDPGPRTARAKALSNCRLRMIGQDALLRELTHSPEIALALLRVAGQRMRLMNQQVQDQVFLPPTPRLAAQLLLLADTKDTIRMSQAELADYVGATREHVSKTLAEWRRGNLVDVGRGRIRLLDRAELARLRDCEQI
ncbi:Crp/Fnr family transcriptional regulator [Aliiruegeria haliotis]|uniref:Crp/Fnr family transcriptional regulator n=1 Tax=Aliiruegeria haliotis TaxID=1280846 RepID=A0A2T0RVF3_9RHOB|nr:Crp/Fnr family transcriptional regulator [Aliiruegeria haliotis]PRY25128.1 Crp/Fnr family transcriptional regulator [Aliiruegeria haliotis]